MVTRGSFLFGWDFLTLSLSVVVIDSIAVQSKMCRPCLLDGGVAEAM